MARITAAQDSANRLAVAVGIAMTVFSATLHLESLALVVRDSLYYSLGWWSLSWLLGPGLRKFNRWNARTA